MSSFLTIWAALAVVSPASAEVPVEPMSCMSHRPGFIAPYATVTVSPEVAPLKTNEQIGNVSIETKFCISRNGLPNNVEIGAMNEWGEANPQFGEASIAAMQRWKFEPAFFNGHQVSVCGCTQEFKFTLDDAE